MSQTMTIRPPKDLQDRYTALAEATGRPRSFYVNKALSESIDGLEEVYGILKDVEDYRAGRLETCTSDELRKRLGLVD